MGNKHTDNHATATDAIPPLEKLDDTAPATAWALPDMAQPGRVVQSAWKEKAKKPPPKEKIEVLETAPEGEPPKGLTVQELTEISDQAQKEGFEAGHKEGLESGKTEGYNDGFDAGSKKAYQQTLQKIEDEKTRLHAIANALLQPMQNQSEQLEQTVVDIALNIAQKLVQAHIHVHPDALFYLVQKTLNSLPAGKPGLQVCLNQTDADLLHTLFEPENDANAGGAYQEIDTWNIQIDNQLTRGGCTVKTTDSLIDLSIDTRINKYLQQLPKSLVETPEPLLAHPGEQALNALEPDDSTNKNTDNSDDDNHHDTHHETQANNALTPEQQTSPSQNQHTTQAQEVEKNAKSPNDDQQSDAENNHQNPQAVDDNQNRETIDSDQNRETIDQKVPSQNTHQPSADIQNAEDNLNAGNTYTVQAAPSVNPKNHHAPKQQTDQQSDNKPEQQSETELKPERKEPPNDS